MRVGWLLSSSLVVVTGACGPVIDRAAFSARRDSLEKGDLLGPFDGIALDAETDRPLSGAVVAASWAFERGEGLTGPAGAHEIVTETGADGRYRVPALTNLPTGGAVRVRRFTLIVYQKGYVAWRSDRRFPDGGARRDFAQRGNRVRLEKWRTGLHHHRHVLFLGGGQAVRAAASWELLPASLELSGGGVASGGVAADKAPVATTAGASPLDIATLLSDEELKGVTGYAGAFDLAKLLDLPTTEFYDSRHFKARGKPESFDTGLRVWRLGPVGAEAQYRKLLAELPGAKPADEIGDASLRARSGDVLGLAYLIRERGVVVSVSCGVQQCTDPEMILRIAKLVESRLAELPALPATPAEDKP